MILKNTALVGELASARAQQPSNPRQRILVVDDDSLIRQLNSEVLICSGYHVDVAEDGAEAWDTLQMNNYDLLVTDHDMPRMTGVGLLKHLHLASMMLPVIMATGSYPEKKLEAQPWLLVDAVLLKPYTVDELLATVKDVLFTVNLPVAKAAAPPNWQGHPLANRLRL